MTDTLRVLHVQYSFHPGGMENGVVNVARRLQPRGFEFHVACLSTEGPFAKRLPDPTLVYPLEKPEGFSFATIASLRNLIGRIRPHLLHTHNVGPLFYAICARRLSRFPPILHGEHATPEVEAEAHRRHLQRQLLFRAAKKVHTVSTGLRQYFIDQGFSPSKLVALVNGVDTERYSPGDKDEARQTLSLPSGSPVLLIVGRMMSSKRHLLLIEAFKEVVRFFPDALLLVVGDRGNAREEVHQAVRSSSVSRQIRMEGFQDDLVPYYRAADLLVAPSRVEGLSNAVLEAMACELCPVLDDACGNAEVVHDGVHGVVRRIDSPPELAKMIIAILSEPSRIRKFGRSARERVQRSFTLASMCDAYEAIYRQLARKID